VTASEDAALDRPDATSVSPQHHSLTVKVLQRPVESAHYFPVTPVTDDETAGQEQLFE
jgi:hypothetical protein